jgi:hypothetical protein
MWVYPCFEGDVDRALMGVQHDLDSACPAWRPWITIGGGSTLGWIWASAVHRCSTRRRSIPWVDKRFERIRGINGFSHKLLSLPHAHMAAYFRWIVPRIERESVFTDDESQYPMDLLASWKSFLEREVPELLSSDDALVALARSMVYQLFEEGDRAYHDFQDILMERYGFACVEKTGWATDVAARTRSGTGLVATRG